MKSESPHFRIQSLRQAWVAVQVFPQRCSCLSPLKNTNGSTYTCWFAPCFFCLIYLVYNLQYKKVYKIFNDLMCKLAFALKFLVYFYNFCVYTICKLYVSTVYF